MPIAKIDEVLEDLRQGKMIILVDDEDRENEGDLTIAAEKVTPEAINFMAKYGRGLICLALSPEIVEQLKLPLMVHDNRSPFNTAFTVSIEARCGVTYFRFAPVGAEFCFGRVRRKAPWTWRVWRV